MPRRLASRRSRRGPVVLGTRAGRLALANGDDAGGRDAFAVYED
jgi:hypothetical protein